MNRKKFFRQSDEPFHVPQMSPGGNTPVPPGFYEALGEQGIRDLIADLYQSLGQSAIAPMFGNLEVGAEKSADFFIGLLGGPPLYHEKHGHPRLRMRHMPFRIDSRARQVWLDCFEGAIDKVSADKSYHHLNWKQFKRFLSDFSAWMVNTADE